MKPFLFTLVLVVCMYCISCNKATNPAVQKLVMEMQDSLTTLMKIRDDAEFFRKYIVFNTEFTMRHSVQLNNTKLMQEFRQELEQNPVFKATEQRVNAVQVK